MKLGEYLKKYRAEHKMTMQEMADACGFSKAYVSLLEKGINPTTGKPFSPTLQTLTKIASATGQDIDSLLKNLDGEQSITLRPADYTFSNEEKDLVNNYRGLNTDGRNIIFSVINSLRFTHSAAI